MNPEKFRAHDYIIDAAGHLLKRKPTPRYPTDQRLRNCILRAERNAEKRKADKKPVEAVSAAEILARQNKQDGAA